MPGQDLPSPAQSSFEEESDDSNNAIRGSDDSEEDKPALSTKTKGLCVIVSDGFPDENSHGRRESTVGKTGGKSSSVTCVEHCRENECEVCHEWGAESGLTLKTL